MTKLNKKGFNLTEVPQLVIVLLVIGIVLGVGATVLTQIQGTQTSATTTRFYENSTFKANNVTAVDFTPSVLSTDASGKTYFVASSCTSVLLTNTSNVAVTSHFTVVGCTALLKDAGSEYNATNIKANFTYSHNVYANDYNISQEGLEGQTDLSEWQTTWVVIVAAAVILGIIYRYLFM